MLDSIGARRTVRIEGENFRHLEGCTLEDRGDKVAEDWESDIGEDFSMGPAPFTIKRLPPPD